MHKWISCDKCQSAQALYLIKLLNGELYFCGHHFNENKASLDKASYEIVQLNNEEDSQLLEKAEI